MIYSFELHYVRHIFAIVFISHAVVVSLSQEMDMVEMTENEISRRHSYSSTPLKSVKDSMTYSIDNKDHRNSPRTKKKLIFHHSRRKSMTGSGDSISNRHFSSSLGFFHQYYNFIRDQHLKNNHLNVYVSVNLSRRKLLSTVQNKKHIRQRSKFHMKDQGKKNNMTSQKDKKTGAKNKDVWKTLQSDSSTNASNSSEDYLEKLALEEYEEFMTVMQQTFSKDPLRAMLSIACLMIVLLLAMKLCGMKPSRRHQEIHADIQEEFHYVNIHDILKRKRQYLPKYLLSWERRLRRKFKRRQKLKKASEQEQLVAPVSDNSEEETLIYSGNYDF